MSRESRASKFADKIRPYLDPDETVIELLDRVTWKSPSGDVPAFAAITDRRLVVAKKLALGVRASDALELSSVVNVATGGGIVPRVTLSTVGGFGITLTALSRDQVAAVQAAVRSARSAA